MSFAFGSLGLSKESQAQESTGGITWQKRPPSNWLKLLRRSSVKYELHGLVSAAGRLLPFARDRCGSNLVGQRHPVCYPGRRLGSWVRIPPGAPDTDEKAPGRKAWGFFVGAFWLLTNRADLNSASIGQL